MGLLFIWSCCSTWHIKVIPFKFICSVECILTHPSANNNNKTSSTSASQSSNKSCRSDVELSWLELRPGREQNNNNNCALGVSIVIIGGTYEWIQCSGELLPSYITMYLRWRDRECNLFAIKSFWGVLVYLFICESCTVWCPVYVLAPILWLFGNDMCAWWYSVCVYLADLHPKKNRIHAMLHLVKSVQCKCT